MQKYLEILSPKDNEVFETIECLREEMMAKNEIINVVDYGAGEPEEMRSKTEMLEGVLKEVSTKNLCRIGLKNDFAHLIYALMKKYKPTTVLELGTCCGFSSIYMSKGLGEDGLIHTIEGSPETAKIAQANFKSAGCENVRSYVGRFNDVLPAFLEANSQLDLAFIDGHHNKDATLEYFKQIKPFLSENALVLFDDISWSEGMIEAWEVIKEDKSIKKYEDFSKLGLCFMGSLK